MNAIRDMLPFLIPLIVIELGLLIFALVDLIRRDSVRGGSKAIWAIIIILINLIGPIVYLIFGRQEKSSDRDQD